MLLSYSTGSYVDYSFCNKTETGTLLADKLINIGDVQLPGWLDIGTSGYTNSRIRCNATGNGGYSGYAELRAYSPYDMFLNLQTTYPNGGWVYFRINNDDYIQLSGSDNKVNIYKDTVIKGRVDVGENQNYSTNWINLHTASTNCNSYKGFMSFTTWGCKNCTWNIPPNTSDVKIEIKLSGKLFMKFFNNNSILHYKPSVNSSGDRLKENEEIIENACETLSKLRPQLYDKKPDIENEDPKSWCEESGLIAQEIYYDAPGLRHLIYRGSPETDEEGNGSPLPEIPTSIDQSQDPDYSSWGKDPAPVNYIGLIAYLVKANTELHERLKALESKQKSKKRYYFYY